MKYVYAILLTYAISVPVSGQTALSLASGNASSGGTISLDLTLASQADVPAAALQWTLGYDANNISNITVTAAPALTAAGKRLTCNSTPGAYVCTASGMNTTAIPSGVIAQVQVSLSAAATNTNISLNNDLGAGADATAIPIPASGASVSVTIDNNGSTGGFTPTVSSLSCNPTTISSSGTSTCTVTLSSAAPAGGLNLVSLSSNNPLLTLVAPVIPISSGATSATFPVTAGLLTLNGTATITASLNGSSKGAIFSLLSAAGAGPKVTSLQCAPATLASNSSASCTVTLSGPAPAGGASVALSANSPSVSVPASVTVPGTATTVAFTINTGSVSSNQTANITASLNGGVQSSSLSLTAPAPLTITSLQCANNSLAPNASTSCTVTLSQAVSSTGLAQVSVSSNNPALTIAAPVIPIGPGGSTATFNPTAGKFSSNQTATITASLNGVAQSVVISLTAPAITATLSSLQCSPASLSSNGSANCTVVLSGAAPAGGANVALSVDSSALAIPASVTVPEGSSTAGFPAAAGVISSNQTATIRASWNGAAQTATLSLAGGGSGSATTISSLECKSAQLAPNSGTTCTVVLSQPVPIGSLARINVSSNNPALSISAPVVPVLGGASSATFSPAAGSFTSSQIAIITASLNGASQSATISLVAPGN